MKRKFIITIKLDSGSYPEIKDLKLELSNILFDYFWNDFTIEELEDKDENN